MRKEKQVSPRGKRYFCTFAWTDIPRQSRCRLISMLLDCLWYFTWLRQKKDSLHDSLTWVWWTHCTFVPG